MNMNKSNVFTVLALLLVIMASCKQQKKENTEAEEAVSVEIEQPKITLEKLDGSPAYASAVLQLDEPKNTTMTKGGEVNFSFTVNDYELGAQTEGPNAEQ